MTIDQLDILTKPDAKGIAPTIDKRSYPGASDEEAIPTAIESLLTSPPRVLVIDDDHDVADSLGVLLETLGATARVVYDGLSGVAAIDEFKPSIVFCDLGMPEIDGYETARRIRQGGHAHRFILVALTGWGQQDTRRRARQVGFDIHLTKPAPIEEIETLLSLARTDAPMCSASGLQRLTNALACGPIVGGISARS